MSENCRAADSVDAHVGSAVRGLRLLRGWSQEELGEAVGVSFQQVQKYELGTNRISASRLARIAEALQAAPGEFFPDPTVADGDGMALARGVMGERDGVAWLECFRALTPEQRKAVLSVCGAILNAMAPPQVPRRVA